MIKRGQLCISYLTLQLERIKLILKLLTRCTRNMTEKERENCLHLSECWLIRFLVLICTRIDKLEAFSLELKRFLHRI